MKMKLCPKQINFDDMANLVLEWRSKRITSSLSRVPPVPGLYAFGWDEKTHLGLKGNRKYVYIGQTDNLRRRLEQHLPRRQPNQKLKQFLISHRNEARCWYCPLKGNLSFLESRLELEKELIQFFHPEINIQEKLEQNADNRQ